jgi:PadR family transcriptional regulator PadR
MTKRSKSFLGDFELTVLLAVLQLGDDAFGVRILEEIEERTGRSPSGGALYITLDRLETKGLIKSSLGGSRTNRGGRPRRYISVTPKGFKAVRESRAAILSLLDGLDELFSS